MNAFLLLNLRRGSDRLYGDPCNSRHASLAPHTPIISTGPCPPTVAGPYAAWVPRKRLHGRTCGVSREGGRARAMQPTCKARRSTPDPSHA
ncbi:hypothetical protein XarzCFBP7410_04765 [Xanthomonas arboricola pv. zantedeschiae]|nr:hypothetical protein XarbCFBP8147_04945 [Xanthomonas arboricola]PPT86486.1 hypothetical protein XarzCFBP7410_04765 [Xanthomonas arboricola pv. zantedeschiae]